MSHDTEANDSPASQQAAEFARLAAQPQPGLLREFWDFLRTNKKWWLAPIIVVLLLVALLLALGYLAGAAPFIYTLF